MNLEYRDFQIGDLKKLADIVGYSFELECYSKCGWIRNRIMKTYLLQYLKGQNYAKVAVEHGEPIGLVVAKIEGESYANKYMWKTFLTTLPLVFTIPGWYYFIFTHQIKKADKNMLAHKNLNTELKLFVVSSQHRGKGVGKRMLVEFQSTCISRGVKDYYLFTDSYCDVDYYLKRSFCLQEKTTIKFKDEASASTFYLFSRHIE